MPAVYSNDRGTYKSIKKMCQEKEALKANVFSVRAEMTIYCFLREEFEGFFCSESTRKGFDEGQLCFSFLWKNI
jgi:hypothetical protein